jgi:tetratricopeptide (TPR) repeat protein
MVFAQEPTMSKRTKDLILLLAIVQILMVGGLMALPSVVQAIPGRYRVALSERNAFLSELTEEVIDRVAPVATALPAPIRRETAPQLDISALLVTEPTTTLPAPTATLPPTDTPDNKATSSVAESLERDTPAPTTVPTATASPSPTTTPEPLPESAILQGIGVIRQTFNNCGPANLTQVLNFNELAITQEQVASYLKPNVEDRNVSPWQIADYVNEQTPLVASAHSGGTLEMLKQFIAAGFPVVVEKGYELPQSGWWGHYVTVFGYDDGSQLFHTQDTYLGPWDGSGRTISYSDMDIYWQQFNYTFYVVYQPAEEARVQAILGADMLNTFTMWSHAASRADLERKADPESAFAWFNLGTSLTRMGEMTGESNYYQGGVQAFDQARELGLPSRMLWYQFRPYMAYWKSERLDDVIALADATLETQGGRNVEETYWYKGHALLSQGKVAEAIAAYEAALVVNQNFYPAQISLDSLR